MSFEIGYRRPPPKSRFAKGKSGNPKGRPKGTGNFFVLLDKELYKSIVVNENGKKKTITRKQAIAKKLVAGALQGDLKALMTLIEVLRRTGKIDEIEAASLVPDDYADVLKSYIAQQQNTDTKTTE